MNRALLVFMFFMFFMFTFSIQAQILDDTTKMVYGPETTKFITEKAIKYNLGGYQPIDTTITNLHRFTYVERYDNQLQNLGNLGTAARPVFYDPPEKIGRTLGFDIYDYYFKGPEKIRYYDTKSPYTDLTAIFAGNNRSMVNIDFSRNIKPNWNAGFNFSRITASRQLSRETQDDRQTFSTYYDFYTLYKTEDEKYLLLANLARLNHEVEELGGINAEDTIYFLYEDSEVFLEDAESRKFKLNAHLYHQYQFNNNIQFYHEFDLGEDFYSFIDPVLTETEISQFYDKVLFSTDSTVNKFKLKYLVNEVGFKGNLNNISYGIYYKRRNVNYIHKYLSNNSASESYGGVFMNMKFDSLHYLNAHGEYMLGGNHKLTGVYHNKYFEAGYNRVNVHPAYYHSAHFGNHHEWHNDFKPPQSDNIYGAINISTQRFLFRPHLSFSLINNYIYFGPEKTPNQISGYAQIISPGVDFNINFLKHFNWNNKLILSKVTGSSKDVFRVPNIFANSKIYYSNILFNSRLELNAGVDLHYKSPYEAYAYDPVTMHFYLLPTSVYEQDEIGTTVPKSELGYVVADVFLNLKIGSVRVFLKYIHINQGEEDGYFVTPFYTGQPGTLSFGVNWLFFD